MLELESGRLRLNVMRENYPALHFWRRLGFQPVLGANQTAPTVLLELDLREGSHCADNG